MKRIKGEDRHCHRHRGHAPSTPTVLMLTFAALLLSDGMVAGFNSVPLRPLVPQMHCVNTKSSAMARSKRATTATSTQILFSTPPKNGDQDQADDGGNDAPIVAEVVSDSLTPSQIESMPGGSFLSNVRGFLSRKTKLNRESLGKLGMSALLAYGFVSNVSGCIAVSCAWFIFSKKTGLSPLANKPAFLTIYAGFTVALNIIRPARFALSMAISPYFERIRKYFQRTFGVGPKGSAVLMIVLINLLGTCTLMALGVGLASVLSGVPVWGS